MKNSKTRFCFYNPHSIHNTLANTLYAFLFKRKKQIYKADSRFGHLLNIFNDNQFNSAIVVDDTATSLTNGSVKAFFLYKIRFLMKIIVFLEIYIWCYLNGFNPFRQTIIFDKNRLNPQTDILFGFAFMSDTFMEHYLVDRSLFTVFKGKKILHGTHYHRHTKRIADNVKRSGTELMIAEADLRKNKYFQKYFPFIKSVYILPPVLRPRYTKSGHFNTRKNICAAFGTYAVYSPTDPGIREYYQFFKNDALHPMRKIIFHNKHKLKKQIDCFIDDGKEEIAKYQSSFFYKFKPLRTIYNMFYQGGSKYFSFDIVKTFNQYKMFIAPEEQTGLPSVNYVEGMGCGCAYVGLDHPIYKDIGMIPGKHYIGYNGTLNDLIKKISYYQQNTAKLQSISDKGYKFVILNFTESCIHKRFWNIINSLD